MVDEQWCVAQALQGDQRAFTELVERYQTPVYNLCYRMLGNAPEAEDAAQETFVRVYRHLADYDAEQKLSSWVLAIASHYCIDRLRRRRITWLSLEDGPPLRAEAHDTMRPEDTAMEQESSAEVRDLLQELPPDYRLVITLRYWQDLSYTEIARIVGSTESAVKSRLHRARRMMAQQILSQGKLESLPCRVSQGKRVADNAVL
jgi:RNA polymerase sigma-70 factor (ECF subfamily)